MTGLPQEKIELGEKMQAIIRAQIVLSDTGRVRLLRELGTHRLETLTTAMPAGLSYGLSYLIKRFELTHRGK